MKGEEEPNMSASPLSGKDRDAFDLGAQGGISQLGGTPADEQAILRTVARLRSAVLAVVLGCLLAVGLFVATAWLIIKGGEDVGAHLQLLGHYFIGYRVSWIGAFIGAAYGFVVGAIMGASIGAVYNRIVDFRHT